MSILKKIEEQLNEKEIKSNLKKINTEKINQERVYVNINKQFLIYFVEFEKKPFLKVFIQRPAGFDYSGVKQSELETERCKKAKQQILLFIRNHGVEIENLENYTDEKTVLLVPTSTKKKIDIL
ncbi:MAG: hypothetical protein H7Z76_03855 [Methylotenera sp.]|nr:hypothetical protein [Flavobacterium sp.]